MRKIQNANITFRATAGLKERLTEYCLESDLHNSAVLRQALVQYLDEHIKVELPGLVPEPSPLTSHARKLRLPYREHFQTGDLTPFKV